jgi:hypothetical protein
VVRESQRSDLNVGDCVVKGKSKKRKKTTTTKSKPKKKPKKAVTESDDVRLYFESTSFLPSLKIEYLGRPERAGKG